MSRNGWTQSNDINWDDVPEGGPAPLEEGLYRAKIISAKPTPTKKEGNPMITLQLEVYEDSEGSKLKSPSGKDTTRKLFDYLPLSQEAMFRVRFLCKAFDLDPKTALPNVKPETAAAFCKQLIELSKGGVYVRIKHETRQTPNDGERTDMKVGRYLSDEQVKQAGASEQASDPDSPPPPRRSRNSAAAQA